MWACSVHPLAIRLVEEVAEKLHDVWRTIREEEEEDSAHPHLKPWNDKEPGERLTRLLSGRESHCDVSTETRRDRGRDCANNPRGDEGGLASDEA